ncbi:MAG TPA: hypothetical protein VGM39_15250 [Kofleriaceae bacterium]|jgi:predicted amidophosphoribosyltransferase
MLERTPDDVLPMPPSVLPAATCACCGARFESDDNELCPGCHEAASGRGAPGPVIPQTLGQRTFTGVAVLLISGFAILRVVLMFGRM